MTEEEIDLDALYESHFQNMKCNFRPGDKIAGTITMINDRAVFVDVNYKSEGVIDRAECCDRKGNLTVAVGDSIEAMVEGEYQGELRLTVRVDAKDVDDSAIAEAFAGGIPVSGKVASERKGGFEILVGEIRGFCPFSQMGANGAEASSLVGQTLSFRITEYNEGNLVVSRRQLLEAERAVAKERMRDKIIVGARLTGTVSRLADFGAFIDLGGVDGLVPMRELSWKRVATAGDVLKEGDKVEVDVMAVDWTRDRISLSMRQVSGDPWTGIADRYHVTKSYPGTVAKLMDFGAFIELEPGVQGLVHISHLGDGKRLTHASEVLSEGASLEVYVESIDLERHRLSLRLDNPQMGRTIEVEGDQITVGSEMTGTVEDIRPFGCFIRLTASHTGLLHISQIDLPEGANPTRMMQRKYPIGSQIVVTVQSVHQNRISLTVPGREDDESGDITDLLTESGANGLGSLGSLFSGLDLKK